jgi:hypothetical protein
MTENGNNKERYYRRVEERHFWARLGVVLLIFCASSLSEKSLCGRQKGRLEDYLRPKRTKTEFQ